MKTLFITYNSALGPLIKSQGIPYLKGLSARGVECILLSFEKPLKDRDAFLSKTETLRKELEASGIKWYRLWYHKRPSLPATLFDMFIGTMLSFWLVISKRVDIIHARAAVPAVMGYTVARFTGRRFIFDERGLMAEEYADGGMWKKGGALYKVTRYIEKKLLNGADAVVVLTENIRDFLLNTDYLSAGQKTLKPDITVIPCCVDTARFNVRTAIGGNLKDKYGLSGKFVFLYTGSVGTWYLLEEMIDFFIAAKSVIDSAHFLILTHIDKEMVKEALEKKKASFDDITVDEAQFENIHDYIKIADAGIFFIKPVLSKRSSCPIKFAEYLACGLPVVINSCIGDTDTIVRKNNVGVIIKGLDVNSYLNGVRELLELKKEEKSLSERCRKVSEELFSLEKGVSKYFEIYDKLYKRRDRNMKDGLL